MRLYTIITSSEENQTNLNRSNILFSSLLNHLNIKKISYQRPNLNLDEKKI